jgi:hypothetical protein
MTRPKIVNYMLFEAKQSIYKLRYCRSADFCAILKKCNRPINRAPTLCEFLTKDTRRHLCVAS